MTSTRGEYDPNWRTHPIAFWRNVERDIQIEIAEKQRELEIIQGHIHSIESGEDDAK